MGEDDIARRMAALRGGDAWPLVRIDDGTMADYARLAHLHYRPGLPRAVARVLVAREASPGRARGAGRPADAMGVLVVARPVLNGPWREAAWPGVFGAADKRRAAARVNAGLRVIARVVVDPRVRGLGVSVALVRAYLRRPLTPRTEAIAAMGGLCPFFARAGMRAMGLAPSERDARLARLLADHGIAPRRLAWTAGIAGAVRRSRALERGVRSWARASRATHRFADGPIEALLEAAARSVPVRRWAYVAGPAGECGTDQNTGGTHGQARDDG